MTQIQLNGLTKLPQLLAQHTTRVLVVIVLFVGGNAMAAKNPLNPIAASRYDAEVGDIKNQPCSEGGTNLCHIHDGAHVVYRGYDLGLGVSTFKARVASDKPGSFEIRLDNPNGILMGKCSFKNTGGWQVWQDVTCPVDKSQAGIRDIYLIFKGIPNAGLLNLKSFVFLKTAPAAAKNIPLGFSNRVDVADDEPRSTHSWGVPEGGFTEDFEDGRLANWIANGFGITTDALGKKYSAVSSGSNFNFAFTPGVYINKTDTGGEWRTLAQASLSADIVLDSSSSRPGIGFSSKDGKLSIYVTLNAANNSIEAWRKLADGKPMSIEQQTASKSDKEPTWRIQPGITYRLQLDWSPYSNGLIVYLKDDSGRTLTSFRTVIDLPAARRPMLVCDGGEARFDELKFDPTLDSWNFKWEWKKEPILASDVCNPAMWKWKDGKYYMMWRKFGPDNFHGIISSTDGVSWTRVKDDVLKCTGDMNVVVDPFGDGKVYITSGGDSTPWWSSDGSDQFTKWKRTELNVGNIFGNNRIQEIVDTKKYKQMKPVEFKGTDYRFIAFTEDLSQMPKPHTVVLLSNTLTDWVLANPDPVPPPSPNFWGIKGNVVGAALVLPDGNILLANCASTSEGYTGTPEPTNVSVIVDGKKPWKVLKLATLPDAPVSREKVWYEGPNFGTALYYETANDTLYYYGGFHDYYIGMMRVKNFSESKLFKGK